MKIIEFFNCFLLLFVCINEFDIYKTFNKLSYETKITKKDRLKNQKYKKQRKN